MKRIAAAAAFLLGGCTAVIVPPAAPERPVCVAVLDHGRHSSLLIERPESGLVRYSYGDWVWYALGRTGAYRGSAALLWPTQGALGRRNLPGPATPEAVEKQVRVGIEDAVWFAVEADAAQRLTIELDGIFEANAQTRIYNPSADLEFVHYPDSYTLTNNSNRRVARWVEALGGAVEGSALLSDWTLRQDETAPRRDPCAATGPSGTSG